MKPLRLTIVLIVALALTPFLPLYVERAMTRSWRVDQAGDVIEWSWKLCTLKEYWSNYRYFNRDQHPALWFSVNLVLAFLYALVIALIIEWRLARRKVRDGRGR